MVTWQDGQGPGGSSSNSDSLGKGTKEAKLIERGEAGLTGGQVTHLAYHPLSPLPPQRDQQEVIRKFRVGTLNLLVATSVAEEGLDIPQCNVVVRYGLLSNEISMVQVRKSCAANSPEGACGTDPRPTQIPSCLLSQARGRARAGQSIYSFVANQGSRELRRELMNEVLETLMERAVAAVQKMDQAEYQAKVCGQGG